LARLVSGAAILKIGATTEVELKEKKERVIDAVEATKAAVEEGIIAGGGTALLRASQAITREIEKTTDKDEHIGMQIVEEALHEPYKKLLENAGIEDKDFWKKDENAGINVETGEIGDMFAMGIIDPKKVTRNAIQNAASVAAMILTTEAIVVDIPKPANVTENT
jgi:chaperonin GroEL